MAPVANLYRLVWGGRLFDAESWSCSVHIDSDVLTGPTAQAFQTAFVAWMGRATSSISQGAILDFIKFNRLVPFVLPNGKTSMRYADNSTNQHLQNDMAVGTFQRGPGQNSVAVTLRTGISRGRASVGRFYPPTGGFIPAADGRIDVSPITSMAVSAATLIRDINTVVAGASTASVVVFSNIGQVVENVQSVRVGRVVDTMRSRRSQLDEQPVTALVNP